MKKVCVTLFTLSIFSIIGTFGQVYADESTSVINDLKEQNKIEVEEYKNGIRISGDLTDKEVNELESELNHNNNTNIPSVNNELTDLRVGDSNYRTSDNVRSFTSGGADVYPGYYANYSGGSSVRWEGSGTARWVENYTVTSHSGYNVQFSLPWQFTWIKYEKSGKAFGEPSYNTNYLYEGFDDSGLFIDGDWMGAIPDVTQENSAYVRSSSSRGHQTSVSIVIPGLKLD